MILCLISSYHYFSALFYWNKIIFKSIKALEIKTSIAFNLVFAKSTILWYFFFFFWITYLYYLIPAVITETFIVIAEVTLPTGILPIEEAIEETDPHPVTVEATINIC